MTTVDHHSLVAARAEPGAGHSPSVREFLDQWLPGTPDFFELRGQAYRITDIGLRMLSPRELARAQSFPDDYVLTGTATSQCARIGNSVPPLLVKALVSANLAA